jgi:hypothetical protein
MIKNKLGNKFLLHQIKSIDLICGIHLGFEKYQINKVISFHKK